MPPSQSSSNSSNVKVIIAIVLTASITLINSSIFFLFFFCHRYANARNRHKKKSSLNFQSGEFRQEILYINEFRIKSSKITLKSSSDEEQLKRDFTLKLPTKSKHQELKTEIENAKESIQFNEQLPKSVAPPPPPPAVPPLPALPPAVKKKTLPPPAIPPLPAVKKKTLPPPPPPMAGGSAKPLRGTSNDTSFVQMKLKPLHWDKVVANADHSMVWNEIIDGSLRFDDSQIELLFGYKHSDSRTPQKNTALSSTSPSQTLQVFLLEPRMSQNTSIILKSIPISRNEILDALLEGHGLATEILEKLARIAPNKEEESKILQFSGESHKLAYAEGFLYYILKALPSAFVRIKAMLFKSNYDSEILHFKESLETLELACKELRNRGLFLKLLEAILKAGNRMNAGTSRGNAQGFNLAALKKLSDVKSTDGKTTLLHFVVEQVARSEGSRHSRNLENTSEYLQRGLQALGGLSSEFSNVKKAAFIDYDCFITTYSSLTTHVGEIQVLVANCNNGERGNFYGEMKGFVEECKEELKVLEEEQIRILELVKRTTKYYQAGATQYERSCLQLFVIVKDFLDMVDKVFIDISNAIRTKNVAASQESRPLPLKPIISPARFLDLLHLTPDSSNAPSFSDTD